MKFSFFPYSSPSLSLWLLLAKLAAQGVSATLCTPNPSFYSEEGYEFSSLAVACPPEGERLNVAFSYIVPPSGAAQVVVEVTHDGDNPVDGITYGRMVSSGRTIGASSDELAICADLKADLDDFFFQGEPKYTCREGLGDGTPKLCSSVSENSEAGTAVSTVTSIWNNSGCEGNLNIKAYVQEIGQSDFENYEVDCISGIQQICPLIVDGDGGSSYTELEEESVCTAVDKHYFHAGATKSYDWMFPELIIPCPPVGGRINAAVSVRQQIAGVADITFAASHDGPDPPAGISLASAVFAFDSCDDLRKNYDDFFSQGEVNQLFCDASLSDDKLLCDYEQLIGTAGEATTQAISVWNDGGCEGNLRLQATAEDYYEGIHDVDITCLSGIELICPEVTEGDGGPAYDATTAAPSDGDRSAGSIASLGYHIVPILFALLAL